MGSPPDPFPPQTNPHDLLPVGGSSVWPGNRFQSCQERPSTAAALPFFGGRIFEHVGPKHHKPVGFRERPLKRVSADMRNAQNLCGSWLF